MEGSQHVYRPPEHQRISWDAIHRTQPPTVAIDARPHVVLCINREWASLIAGALLRMAEFEVWEGSFEERADGIDQIEALLIQLGKEGICVGDLMFRQNPINPCIAEYSINAGADWFEMFNHALCQVPAPTTASSFFYDLDFNWLVQLGLIFPDTGEVTPETMVYDTTSDDDLRDDALCYALHRWVDAVCEAEIARRTQDGEVLRGIANLAAVVGGIVGGVFSAGTMTLVVYGILLAEINSQISTINATSLAALQDMGARAEVACCMYDNLNGATADHTAFQAALNSCTPALGTNALEIRDVIQEIDAQEEAYTSFALAVVDGFDFAKLELLPGCECDTWTHDFLDGDNDASEWDILPYDNTGSNECSGTYNAGADRFDGCNAGSGFSHAILIEAEIPSTIITRVRLTTSGVETRSSSSHNVFIYLNDSEVQSDNFNLSWTDEDTEWTGHQTVSKIGLRCAAALNGGAGTPDSRITQIRIEGKGTNPFA